MAKFSQKGIEFKDYQKATFGTDDDAGLYWDDARDEMTITTVISGVDPTEPGHLTTRQYVDTVASSATAEFPRYYIEPNITVLVNDYGQYAIRETKYIEVAGTLEFGNGGMLIIV